MSRWNSISCGWSHSLLVTDGGKFYGWGVGPNGELGIEKGFVEFTARELKLSADVPKTPSDGQVVASSVHSLILSDGKVFSMGLANNGRLGHAHPHGQVVIPNDEKIVFIAGGSDSSMAIGESRTNLFAWGLGQAGNLGDGHQQDRNTPVCVRIKSPLDGSVLKISQVSCGSRHSLALCENGSVFSWGSGANGRLGHGNTLTLLRPTRIEAFMLSEDERIVQLVCGDNHSLARSKDGSLYSWGSGSFGRLGIGAESDQYTPALVDHLKGMQVTGVAAGTFHSIAIVQLTGENSSLYSWGGGKYGKLGLGNTKNQFLPMPIARFSRKNAQVVNAACGLNHSVCITISGEVWAWGYATKRCIGMDVDVPYVDTPKKMDEEVFGKQPVVNRLQVDRAQQSRKLVVLPKGERIAVGAEHSVCLCNGVGLDGRPDKGILMSWGTNSQYQLGAGYHKVSFKPVRVQMPLKMPVQAVACGVAHSLAVSRGSVFAWGLNSDGQLGIGNFTNCAQPMMIKALQGTLIHTVLCGHSHSAAITKSRSNRPARAYVWGSNKSGQLGLGKNGHNVATQSTPTPVMVKGYHDLQLSLGEKVTLVLGTTYRAQGEAKRREAETFQLNSRASDIMASIKDTHVFIAGSGDLGLHDNTHETYSFRRIQLWEGYDANNPPKVKSVSAGSNACIAVMYHQRIEQVYAWGKLPGLDPFHRMLPKRVVELGPEQVQEKMRSAQQAVHHLNVLQVASAHNHVLLLLRINNDKKCVFAFGETKYGKLGVGNVAQFNEELRRREQLKRQQRAAEMAGHGLAVSAEVEDVVQEVPSALPPAHVAALDEHDIVEVACLEDHCVAIGRLGLVLAWGYGNGGRLGLGGDDASRNKSETTPVAVTSFFHHREEKMLMDEFGEEEEDYLPPEHVIADQGGGGSDKEEKGDQPDEEGGEEEDGPKFEQVHDLKRINQARSLKPKMRFAVITHSKKLIQRSEKEVGPHMEDYLATMSKIDNSMELIEMALQHRLEQAAKLSGRRNMLRHRGNAMTKSQSPLNALEIRITQFYMSPCLMHEMYTAIAAEQMALREEEKGEDLKRDVEDARDNFVDFVFAVYNNLHTEEDVRLFKHFFQMMLDTHVHAAPASEDILKSDSVEWAIFERVFHVGKIRRQITKVLEKPLLELGRKRTGADQTKVLRTFGKSQAGVVVDEVKVEAACNELMMKAEALFNDLTGPSMVRIMGLIDWLVQCLYECFHFQKRTALTFTCTIGRRLLRALAIVMLENQDEREGDARFLGRNEETWVLQFLKGVADFDKYMQSEDRYATVLKKNALPRSIYFFWMDPKRNRGLSAYWAHVATNVHREGQDNDDILMRNIFDRQKLLLKDFLRNRTIRQRRMLHIPFTCFEFLELYEYLHRDLRVLWESESKKDPFGFYNVRLDTFKTEQNTPVVHCRVCDHFHPKVDLQQDLGGDIVAEATDLTQIIKGRIHLSGEVCSSLWGTLKHPDFQEIAAKQAGEGGWKSMLRLLKQNRQRAVEKRKFDAVERFEEAFRVLRRIRDARVGTVVFLGNELRPSIRPEMLDASRFLQRLKEIDGASEVSRKNAVRNVELFLEVANNVRELKHEADVLKDEMRNVFEYLTGVLQDSALADFKSEHRSNAKSKLREFRRIHIAKPRGCIQSYSYLSLRKMGVLPMEANGKVKQLCGCLPLDMCLCLRSEEDEQRSAMFFANLTFHFSTTEHPDTFQIKIVYKKNTLLRTASVNLDELQSTGDRSSRSRPPFVIEYDPQGDNVPILSMQRFNFHRKSLYALLESYPRPGALSGRGLGEARIASLTAALSAD